MKSKIELEITPYGEPCAQFGDDDYEVRANAECRAFISQLRRTFGQEPKGARWVISRHNHDFGVYLGVCFRFDDEDETHLRYEAAIDGNIPELWDETAQREMALDTRAENR